MPPVILSPIIVGPTVTPLTTSTSASVSILPSNGVVPAGSAVPSSVSAASIAPSLPLPTRVLDDDNRPARQRSKLTDWTASAGSSTLSSPEFSLSDPVGLFDSGADASLPFFPTAASFVPPVLADPMSLRSNSWSLFGSGGVANGPTGGVDPSLSAGAGPGPRFPLFPSDVLPPMPLDPGLQAPGNGFNFFSPFMQPELAPSVPSFAQPAPHFASLYPSDPLAGAASYGFTATAREFVPSYSNPQPGPGHGLGHGHGHGHGHGKHDDHVVE